MVVGNKDKGKPANAKGKGNKDDKAIDESFDPIKIDARQANTVVLMLDSPEDEVLQKTCESIFKFCEKSDTNVLNVHELGATPKIFNLLSHEDRLVQRNATMVFGILSGNSEVRKYLRKYPDCITKMITLLSSEYDPLANEYAAMWLKNMSEDYSTKTVIVNTVGALASLVNMLEASDADAIFNSLGAIDRLMDDFQARQAIRETKGIESIMSLMKSEFPQIQELVFSSLTKITQNAENREAFRDLNGLEKLVEFLADSSNKDMHINCLNVLSNCLEDTQCLDLIQQTGGLTKILAFFQDSSEEPENHQLAGAAARVIARSARKPENRKILNEQFAEKMLIYLLLCDNDETKASAAYALSIMAESVFSQEAIRNNDGIEALLRLGSSENAKVREYACLSLSNLTNKNTNNRRHLLNNQGIEVIMSLLKDERDTTKAYACVCLCNMALDEIVREEVAQNTFGQSIIVALASTNTLTQARACSTVAAYSVDSAIRNELKLFGAIPLIIEHLKSNDDEVRSAACWAINCSAIENYIAIDYCKHGAIEILRDLNQSFQRKSKFTEMALNRLLEYNLSAKYALNNFLDANDTIVDGFYDMGPMRPNGKFYTLDELCKIPINDKRPVIIVYAPEEIVEKSNVHLASTASIEKPTTPVGKGENSGKTKTSSAKGSSGSLKSASQQKDAKTSSKAKKSSIDAKKSVVEDTKVSASVTNLNNTDDMQQNQVTYGMDVYKPIFDKDLKVYIEQAKDSFQFKSSREQTVSLAKFVSSKFGGTVTRDEVNNLGYELLINETKYDIKSNIVPIGKIKLGTYYHRALLFKILADKLHLKVTLERGDYNRAWNTVSLKDENSNSPPKSYIIDLIHEPGKIMPANSLDAIQYVKFV